MPDDTPNLSSLNDVRPNIPPPQQTDIGQAPDLGNLPMPGAPSPQPLPPRPGTGIGTPPPPQNKADFFRKMLGDFFYAAGTGLANAGHGPGSFGRGLGAGLTALPERDIAMQHIQIQRQQAQALADLRNSQAQQFEPTPVTVNGQTIMLPAVAARQILAAQVAGQSRENVQGEKNTGAETVQGLKNTGATTVQGLKNTSQEKQTEEKLTNAQLLTDKKIKSSEKIAQWRVQGAKDVAQLKVIAGQAARDAKADEPTAQAKNSAETARVVQGGIERIIPMIDQLNKAGALGAFKGKMLDLQEGKIGMDALGLPPDQARLAMNFIDSLKFINSGMLKTHFGARGGQQMYEKFTQMLNAGQDVNTMKGGLDAFKFYADSYAAEGNKVGGARNVPKAGGVQGGEYDFVNGQLVPRKNK